MNEPLLEISDLRVHVESENGTIRAVDGVDLAVDRGETVCLVGESGAGKSVTCESITRLLSTPPAEYVSGRVEFDGRDLMAVPERDLRAIRGDRIAHVFQNPQHTLDPVYTVGDQLVETIRYHRDVPKAAARERAVELLDLVGIPNPAARAEEYPHQFSGGMRQRAVIAAALAPDPDLLIADEPTTALDVTVEAAILDIFSRLQAERDMAILFVTHDLGVVAEVADRVVVMYAGTVVEEGDADAVFADPAHPYTRALLACLPGTGGDLEPIGGPALDPTDPPDGCRFHPRCPHAEAACRGERPPPWPVDDEGHSASCIYYGPDRDAAELRRADGAAADEPTPGGDGP